MSLLNSLNNLLKEIKNKKDINSNELKVKYNDLYKASEKLFDKILDPKLKSEELNIIRIMLEKKEEREKGLIEKFDADKQIGEVLCNTYVKPMLNNKK